MTERERWIVYPLLLFALGAALRDKFTHTMRTDELRAGRILCEEIKVANGLSASSVACQSVTVFDPQNLTRPLALLTSATIEAPRGGSKRLGSLLLTDSEGRELFGLADDQIKTRHIVCEGVAVLDPDNSRARPLAALSSDVDRDENGKPRRYGVLSLNNRQYKQIPSPPRPASDAEAEAAAEAGPTSAAEAAGDGQAD